jgi:hypothetical protein
MIFIFCASRLLADVRINNRKINFSRMMPLLVMTWAFQHFTPPAVEKYIPTSDREWKACNCKAYPPALQFLQQSHAIE